MPRPHKRRRVCRMPAYHGFAPIDSPAGPPILLGIAEFEAVRLIDLEGLTQEQCAAQMEVARTTVTGIYDHARRKLADALVNGRTLRIEGGDYAVCEGTSDGCPRKCCHHACAERGPCHGKHSPHFEKGSIRHENRGKL